MDRDHRSAFPDVAPGLDRRRFGFALASTFGAALAGGCARSRGSFRFHMTLSATTEGMRYSSNSVIEAIVALRPFEAGHYGSGIIELRGDAAAVDLPGGRTLFALRDQALALHIARLFGPEQHRPEPETTAYTRIEAGLPLGATRALDGNPFPELALLDKDDPSTLRPITPAALATLGIAPVATLVTITDAAPTRFALAHRYPWFAPLAREVEKGGPSHPVPLLLSRMH